MKRRLLLIVPLALGNWTAGRAQPAGKVWRVGFLGVRREPALQAAFARGMREFGYSDGRNLLIEARSADGRPESLAGLADAAVTNLRSAASQLRMTIQPVEVRSPAEIEPAFSAMTEGKSGALVVMRDGLFLQQQARIAELALKHRLATISDNREYVDAGALMSYGPNLNDQFRRVATHVDKIFKGAKPGDLPVEQPTTFECVINLKTAKALGLKIPQSLLLLADEVIQ